MADNRLPKKGIVDSLIDINYKLQRIQRQLCCSNDSGGGITSVVVGDSDTIAMYGTGVEGDPIYAELINGSDTVTTIYTGDGYIPAGVRTATIVNGGELYIVANPDVANNRADFQIRGGGGNSGVRLMANGQTAGISAGQYGFKLYNGGDTNTDVNISGGGSFQVTDLDAITLRRGTTSGQYSQINMNPSNIAGMQISDTATGVTGFVQTWYNSQNSGNPAILHRAQNSTLEGRITLTPSLITFNRILNSDGIVTPVLSVDTTNQQVRLNKTLSAQTLGTDSSGNIQAGPQIKGGLYSYVSDGSTMEFQIPTGISTNPTTHFVTRNTDSSGTLFGTSVNTAGYIDVTFVSTPPPAGTLTFNWGAFWL